MMLEDQENEVSLVLRADWYPGGKHSSRVIRESRSFDLANHV